MKIKKIHKYQLIPGDKFYMSNSKGERARSIFRFIKHYKLINIYGSFDRISFYTPTGRIGYDYIYMNTPYELFI